MRRIITTVWIISLPYRDLSGLKFQIINNIKKTASPVSVNPDIYSRKGNCRLANITLIYALAKK